jgi:hypothetical protein
MLRPAMRAPSTIESGYQLPPIIRQPAGGHGRGKAAGRNCSAGSSTTAVCLWTIVVHRRTRGMPQQLAADATGPIVVVGGDGNRATKFVNGLVATRRHASGRSRCCRPAAAPTTSRPTAQFPADPRALVARLRSRDAAHGRRRRLADVDCERAPSAPAVREQPRARLSTPKSPIAAARTRWLRGRWPILAADAEGAVAAAHSSIARWHFGRASDAAARTNGGLSCSLRAATAPGSPRGLDFSPGRAESTNGLFDVLAVLLDLARKSARWPCCCACFRPAPSARATRDGSCLLGGDDRPVGPVAWRDGRRGSTTQASARADRRRATSGLLLLRLELLMPAARPPVHSSCPTWISTDRNGLATSSKQVAAAVRQVRGALRGCPFLQDARQDPRAARGAFVTAPRMGQGRVQSAQKVSATFASTGCARRSSQPGPRPIHGDLGRVDSGRPAARILEIGRERQNCS